MISRILITVVTFVRNRSAICRPERDTRFTPRVDSPCAIPHGLALRHKHLDSGSSPLASMEPGAAGPIRRSWPLRNDRVLVRRGNPWTVRGHACRYRRNRDQILGC